MIELKNISHSFHRRTIYQLDLFRNLSLTVNDGDFISIVGSNGAGKSTLLNLFAGMFPPDEGNVYFDGADVTKQAEHQRAKHIGRVFQDPKMGTCPEMTVRENMSIAFNKQIGFNLSRGVSKKNDPHFLRELESFNMGLENFININAGVLSGGQRQALSLLMALESKPRLLLLDEHTAALDPISSEIVMEKTDLLIKNRAITTVMITHNLATAIKYGNRLIMMHKGDIVYDINGEEKKSLTTDKLMEIFQKANNGMSDRMLFG